MENSKVYVKPTAKLIMFDAADVCADSGCFGYDQFTNIVPWGQSGCQSGQRYDGSGTTDEI